MKDYTEQDYRAGRPELPAHKTIKHCLRQLFADNKHRRDDYIAPNLTYEELIGALLQAEDMIRP